MAFQGFLKQSTAVDVLMGPFLDEDNGKDAEAGLTISQADVKLSKNGQTLDQKNDANPCAADGSDGYYNCPLNGTDTNTVGQLTLVIHESGALPVRLDYHVVEEAVYTAMYGASAAGPLQSTTAARTLDVTATGAAGIDWSNVENQGTGVDLSATDIQLADTTTAVTNTVNANAVSAIAAFFQDCFTVDSGEVSGAEVSGSLILEVAKVVWDRVLTGATHNIATSAGRRLRGIQEFQGYENGAIWIDTVNGTAGTTDYENGTVENPVNSLANANTIAASLNMVRFQLLPGSEITLAASQDAQEFGGSGWTLHLGGQSISGSAFFGADTVDGIATGANSPRFISCHFGDTTLPPAHLDGCGLEGTLTAGSAGDFFFNTCHSGIAGTSTPVFDFGSGLNASNANFRRYSGGIEIQNMGAGSGSYDMSLEGDGQLVINANCSATSAVAIRGNFTVTDNASGAVTLSDEARFEVQQITGGTYSFNTTASGNVGIDWANVENPTTAVDLSATDIQLCDTVTTNTDLVSAADVVNEWETQSQADPTGFHVNVLEVGGTNQTAGDIIADTNDIQGRLPAALASGRMSSDSVAISGSTDAADKLEASAETIVADSVDTGYSETTTTFKGGGTATLSAVNDHYNGRIVIFTSGTLANQATDITDYDGTTKVFTVTALTSAPADGVTFNIV